jgi:hypothetical protein
LTAQYEKALDNICIHAILFPSRSKEGDRSSTKKREFQMKQLCFGHNFSPQHSAFVERSGKSAEVFHSSPMLTDAG